MTNSYEDSLDCRCETVSVRIEPIDPTPETTEAVNAMFRAIHATATSEGRNFGQRQLRISGIVEGQDQPMNGVCERRLSLVVRDPAQVVID